MSKNLGSSLDRGFLVFLLQFKHGLLYLSSEHDIGRKKNSTWSYKYLEKTLFWFCIIQAHLSILNNLELCTKAFFRNDNILKPRNADNDVYEKQHQFNASKHSKCVSCSSCILPRGQYSLLTRVSLNINENHKHWNEPESVLLSLSIFIIFIYRKKIGSKGKEIAEIRYQFWYITNQIYSYCISWYG